MANYKANNFCPQPLRGETDRPQTESHELVNVHSLASLRLWIIQAHGSLLGGAQGSWQALTSHTQPRGSKETGSGTIADGRDGNTSGRGRRRVCPRHSCLMGVIREHQRTRAKEGAKGQENDFFRTNIKKRWLQVSYSQQKRVNLQTGTHYDLNRTIKNEATPHHGISHCLSPQPC